jgi:hypothetical protein
VGAVGERSRFEGMLPDGRRSSGRRGRGEVTSGLEGRLGLDLELVRGLLLLGASVVVGDCGSGGWWSWVEGEEAAALWSWMKGLV